MLTLKAMLIAERMESERLRQIVREFQRHRFGRRSESLSEDQLQLALEDTEQEAVSGQAGSEQKSPAERKARAEAGPRSLKPRRCHPLRPVALGTALAQS
jgi:transposase